MRTAAAFVAVSILAGPVTAQTFEPRVGFRIDHQNIGMPNVPPGWDPNFDVVNMQMLFGAFNAQGFAGGNRGTFSFVGTVTVTDPVGQARVMAPTPPTAVPRDPYDNSNIVQFTPMSISFDLVRDFAGTVDVP